MTMRCEPLLDRTEKIKAMSIFDVTATVRLPGKAKATVTFQGTHDATIELTDDERQTLEDLLIQIIERRRSGRHG